MHDYEFPPEWAAMSPAERDHWFKQERARRQALNQHTAFSVRNREDRRRASRRLNARDEVVLGDE